MLKNGIRNIVNRKIMKREIIYIAQKSITQLHEEGNYEEKEVLLKSTITKYTKRRLFGIIPLRDKYEFKIEVIPVTNKHGRTLNVKKLTFESQKRVVQQKRELEAFITNKCKEYKNKE